MNLLEERPAFAPAVRMRTDAADRAAVLLFPEGVLELNETAEAILRRCDGSRSVNEIVRELAQEYEMEPAEIAADVCECVSDLVRRKLLILTTT